jgi:Zn-dependent protease
MGKRLIINPAPPVLTRYTCHSWQGETMFGADFEISTIVARIIVLLIAFTIHELAHAVSADYLGDPTPRRQGRITLNPIAHLDPIGAIALVLVGFGWAKPVMVNPAYMRGNPRTNMAIVAAMGPISNVLMALLAVIPVRLGLVAMTSQPAAGGFFPSFDYLIFEFIWINLILAFFNLIPLPPLDGSKILTGIVPDQLAYPLLRLEQYGPLLLMAIIFILPSVGLDVMQPLVVQPSIWLFRLLAGVL